MNKKVTHEIKLEKSVKIITSKKILIRGSPYPDINITTNPKQLLGYSKVKAFIDFWYETGKSLEYKPKNNIR